MSFLYLKSRQLSGFHTPGGKSRSEDPQVVRNMPVLSGDSRYEKVYPMSYQVLARKWRPQVFEDVAGQGHITRTLQNAITSGRLAHAFLFSGPRGVGKTTTARILAKALNCVQGPTPTPCGVCSSCLETTAGTSVDVIEIDGASNRGIEHIRELREAVKYAPVGGKHKVYVIDEVHMLTNEAFNALLKTLEEPPPRVIFIFATTEPQKIPATIHSRCQRYGFKRVALHDMIERLRTIATAEGISITDPGLAMLARAAEGSMRDSQSLLDQAVSYSGLQIVDADLQAILGSVSQELLLHIADDLLARNTANLLKLVDTLVEQGQDIRQVLTGIIEHLRNLLVVKATREPGSIIELPAADVTAIKQQAEGAEAEQVLMLFDALSRTLDEMRWSPHQRFTFEIGLIKACSISPLKPLGEVLARMQELEAQLSTRSAVPSPSVPAAQRVSERPVEYRAGKPDVKPPVRPGAARDDSWGGMLAVIRSMKPSLATILQQSTMQELTDKELTIGIKGSFPAGQADKPENRVIIEQAAAQCLGRTVRIKIQPLAGPSMATPGESAPSLSKKKSKADEPDPIAHDIAKLFDGEVLDSGLSEE